MDLDSALTGKPAEGASATDLLRADHREVSALFGDYERARGAGQTRDVIAQTLAMQLELHDTVEREIFYPAVRARNAEWIDSALEKHDEIARLTEEVRQHADEHTRCDRLIGELKQLVDRHVHEEEQELFRRVEQSDAGSLRELGEKIVQLKEELTRSTQSFEGPAT